MILYVNGDSHAAGAEINMIIAVGKGTEPGIWGPRYRVPYNEVVVVR